MTENIDHGSQYGDYTQPVATLPRYLSRADDFSEPSFEPWSHILQGVDVEVLELSLSLSFILKN